MARQSLKLYYVTNRNLEKDKKNKPTGYGISQSQKDGMENLRLGKVILDVEQKELDKYFNKETPSGPGDGVGLSNTLKTMAKKRSRIVVFAEKDPHNPTKAKLGSQEMRKEVQQAMRAGQDVLLYVHGFNVSWWDAVGSAFALQAMLNRPGGSGKNKEDVLVILYTWPSDGAAIPFHSYGSDRTDAIGSGFALGRAFIRIRKFLEEATKTPVEKGKRGEHSTTLSSEFQSTLSFYGELCLAECHSAN